MMSHSPSATLDPQFKNAAAPLRKAFTLTEVLVTVGVLIILMGLAVSLAREVRRRSADLVTREALGHLERMMIAYEERFGGVPVVPPLIDETRDPPDLDPVSLSRRARRNNEALIAALLVAGVGFGSDELMGRLPGNMYDNHTLRDAWGSPIVFMPGMHPAIGMADDDRPYFFVSAGPDANYLTREDNLYSYEGR
jgi:hypothetical protein